MNVQSEYYLNTSKAVSTLLTDKRVQQLESLITDANKGKGFQNIVEIFEDNVIYPQQKHGKTLLNEMDRLINKELDHNEFEHVRLLMKCVQYFCKTQCHEGLSLIQQGLVSKDICKCGSEEGIKELQDSFLLTLGYVIQEKWLDVGVQLEALKTLNCIIDNVPRDDKKKFCSSEELCELMQSMAKNLFEVGDYDVQVAITEVLCRMATKKNRDNFAPQWFEDSSIAKAFQEINEKDFETDSRKFLNYLNSRFQEKRVYTFPCNHIYTDVEELVRPQDEKLENFWIDFNVVSRCVSFYVQNKESNLWDSVRLYKDMLSGYSLQVADGLQILNIYLKSPLTVSLMEIKHFKIHFGNFLDIFTGIIKTYGRELQIVSSEQNDNLRQASSTPVGTSTVKAMTATPQQRKTNQSNLSPNDFASDIVNSISDHHSPTKLNVVSPETFTDVDNSQDDFEGSYSSDAPLPTTGENTTVLNLPDTTRVVSSAGQKRLSELFTKVFTASNRETKGKSPNKLLTPSTREMKEQSANKLLTPSTREMKEQSANKLLKEGTKETKGRSPKKHAAQKSEFDFEDSPESIPDIKMSIGKEIFFTTVSSSSSRRNGATQRRTRSQDSTKKAVNYREFDSTESDDAVTIVQDDENWSMESKKRSLTPSADYSRKKLKAKSKLRVLPLSSESSSDDETKAKKSADGRKKETNNDCGKAESLAFPDLPGVSGLLTPIDSAKQRSTGTFAVFDSDNLQEKSLENQQLVKSSGKQTLKSYTAGTTATEGSEDETVLLPKKSHSSGTVEHLKRKRVISSDEDHEDDTFKPRKLFSSCERKQEEVKEGVLQSDSHEPFGSLADDLKNKMMSRYKSMGARTQNVLSTLHLQVSNLLDQIQQVNLRKLNYVNKIIEQEISKFETETQALKDIEKETLEFLEAETMTINSFCANQKQRIEEIDSALNETVYIQSENEDKITDV